MRKNTKNKGFMGKICRKIQFEKAGKSTLESL